MQRVAYAIPIKPDQVENFRRTYHAVWEEQIEANTRAGIRNYTIYLYKNQLIGCLECDNWDEAVAYLAKSDVQKRWEAHVGHLYDVDTAPGSPWLLEPEYLEEVFHQD